MNYVSNIGHGLAGRYYHRKIYNHGLPGDPRYRPLRGNNVPTKIKHLIELSPVVRFNNKAAAKQFERKFAHSQYYNTRKNHLQPGRNYYVTAGPPIEMLYRTVGSNKTLNNVIQMRRQNYTSMRNNGVVANKELVNKLVQKMNLAKSAMNKWKHTKGLANELRRALKNARENAGRSPNNAANRATVRARLSKAAETRKRINFRN
jgi:hypothetical protein